MIQSKWFNIILLNRSYCFVLYKNNKHIIARIEDILDFPTVYQNVLINVNKTQWLKDIAFFVYDVAMTSSVVREGDDDYRQLSFGFAEHDTYLGSHDCCRNLTFRI